MRRVWSNRVCPRRINRSAEPGGSDRKRVRELHRASRRVVQDGRDAPAGFADTRVRLGRDARSPRVSRSSVGWNGARSRHISGNISQRKSLITSRHPRPLLRPSRAGRNFGHPSPPALAIARLCPRSSSNTSRDSSSEEVCRVPRTDPLPDDEAAPAASRTCARPRRTAQHRATAPCASTEGSPAWAQHDSTTLGPSLRSTRNAT